jgi:hypothetical protein
VAHLGYPSYFLVLLGTWKVLGAAALLVPRQPLLKEWAYAGAFFTYTGAMISYLTTGYDLPEVAVLGVMTTLTVTSWALRQSAGSVRENQCPWPERTGGSTATAIARRPYRRLSALSSRWWVAAQLARSLSPSWEGVPGGAV